jgi:hypothetical protein
MSMTITELTSAVRDTLGEAPSIVQAQAAPQMTEAIPDAPMFQVYLQKFQLSANSQTDRNSFAMRGAQPKRHKVYSLNVDVYGHVRSTLGEEMALLETLLDELITILEAQNTKPYFGLDAIDTFKVNDVDRAVIEVGSQSFSGYRIPIDFHVI